jgi:hypothetical protein
MNKKLGLTNKHIPLNKNIVKEYVMMLCDRYESGLEDITSMPDPFNDQLYITFSNGRTVLIPPSEQREAVRSWNERPATAIIPYVRGTIEKFNVDLMKVDDSDDESENDSLMNGFMWLTCFVLFAIIAFMIIGNFA